MGRGRGVQASISVLCAVGGGRGATWWGSDGARLEDGLAPVCCFAPPAASWWVGAFGLYRAPASRGQRGRQSSAAWRHPMVLAPVQERGLSEAMGKVGRETDGPLKDQGDRGGNSRELAVHAETQSTDCGGQRTKVRDRHACRQNTGRTGRARWEAKGRDNHTLPPSPPKPRPGPATATAAACQGHSQPSWGALALARRAGARRKPRATPRGPPGGG